MKCCLCKKKTTNENYICDECNESSANERNSQFISIGKNTSKGNVFCTDCGNFFDSCNCVKKEAIAK